MDFVDDEAEVSSDVLVPSSQPERNPRPRKRRRVDADADSSSFTENDDYDLPPQDEADGKENKKSKYEDRIYAPVGDRQTDTFVTQLTQQYSSPSRIRGPRWMKPRKSPSPSPAPPRFQTNTVVSTRPVRPAPPTDDEFEVDDDDLELLAAFDDAVLTDTNIRPAGNHIRPNGKPVPRQPLQKSNSFRQTTLHGVHTTQQDPLARKRNQELTIGRSPIGTNRQPITRSTEMPWGLFHNILVALPTGLGKTFIAATVMLNWYRWTKTAQIIFVAPTKPLVSQQIDACFNIVGIPRSDTTMLTGEVSPAIRAEEWQEKRVFFMTPQTLINDLKHGYCDPKKVVLVVIDEAHKATGSYAYVEVVKFLRRYNTSFRVLALTATPGKDVETVQEVIDGLGIARVEIRTEESLDIRDFVHSRNIETQIFDNSEEMTMALELLSATLQPLLNKLHSQGASWGKDPTRITLFGLKNAWEKWQSSEPGRKAPHSVKGMVKAISTTLMSLAHNIELLKYHGIGPFYHKMTLFTQNASGKYAKQIINDENFKKLMSRLTRWINNPDFIGHPKLTHLKSVVLNHFMNVGEGVRGGTDTGASNTRIMVFAHYRDSAEEIVRVLNRYGPMIRAHVFVGQSSTKGGSEGMNQKTQLDIIQKFKEGKYNTIVATSIGEEGLDIGEVDLIVCYDCSKSPIRMLQRMGRTGRKRAGNIVLLMMRGKEEQDFNQSEDNYQKMQAKIANGKEFNFHDEQSPRIVPKEIIPAVDKRVVEIPVENTQLDSVIPTRRKAKNAKKPPKKFYMPDGVETGFTFLGNGDKKSKAQRQKPKTPQAKKDCEVAALPSLEDVLLSEAEEQQLEDRYIRLAGIDDEYIQYVRFDAYPEQQQRLGKTHSVKHSKRTKTLVKAYRAMQNSEQDWERPSKCEEVGDNDDLLLDLGADKMTSMTKLVAKKSRSKSQALLNTANAFGSDGLESDVPHALTKSKAKLQSFTYAGPSSETLGSSSIGQYDGNDSFIDDDDAEELLRSVRRKKSNPLPAETGLEDNLSPLALLRSPESLVPVAVEKSEVEVMNRLFVSQQSINYDAMDDELPDLEDLVSSKKRIKLQSEKSKTSTASSSPMPMAMKEKQKANGSNAKSRKRARRVLDSDDDE